MPTKSPGSFVCPNGHGRIVKLADRTASEQRNLSRVWFNHQAELEKMAAKLKRKV